MKKHQMSLKIIPAILSVCVLFGCLVACSEPEESFSDVSPSSSESTSSDGVSSEETITSTADTDSYDTSSTPSSANTDTTTSADSAHDSVSDSSSNVVSDVASENTSNNQPTVSETVAYPNVTPGPAGRFTTTLYSKYAHNLHYEIQGDNLFLIYDNSAAGGRWISVVDLTTGEVIKDVKVSFPLNKKMYCTYINDEAFWVACLKPDENAFAWRNIIKFDLETLEPIETIAIPDYQFKEFEVYGDYIYFCEEGKDSVWRYNMKDGTYLNMVKEFFEPFEGYDYTFYNPTIEINDHTGDLLICDGNNNFALIDTNKMAVKSTAFATRSPSNLSGIGNVIYHNGYFYVRSKKIDANHVGNIVCIYGTGSKNFHSVNDKYVITTEGFFRNENGKLISNLQDFPTTFTNGAIGILHKDRFALMSCKSKIIIYNYPVTQVLPYGSAY